MTCTAGEVAQQLGVSIDTIRRWEKKGLIKGIRSTQNYRLFKMDEVVRLHRKMNGDGGDSRYDILKKKKKTTYKAIELFAGAGGTALGMEHAGIQHVFLNELDRHAAQTLRINRPDWDVREGDVRELDFKGEKADIVQAGFPCQAFSYAGKKMGFSDTRGTLFFEFARCIRDVQPAMAVGENVRGLINHDGGKTLRVIMNTFAELGYKAEYRVLRSQYLDVPQKRERLVIIAVRNDLDIPISFPEERDYTISLREALADCPPSPGQAYPPRKYEVMKLIPEGGYWRDLPEAIQKEYMGAGYYHTGGRTGMARRLSWTEPSLTLTCSPAQKQTERCHPEETRPLTVREYARIQTFPDTWEFCGSVGAQYRQIGNAVPVNLSYHIGRSVVSMLDKISNVDRRSRSHVLARHA